MRAVRMSFLYPVTFSVIIFTSAEALHSAMTNATPTDESALHVISSLRLHMKPHDEVALGTCGQQWDEINHFWLKRLPWAVTTWRLHQYRDIESYVRRNIANSLMTNILVHSLGEYPSRCIGPHFQSDIIIYTVQWILLRPDESSVQALRQHISLATSRNFTCELRVNRRVYKDRSATSPEMSPVLFSRACTEQKRGPPLSGKQSELRNTVIHAACIDLPHLRPANNKPDCNSYESDAIFDAIRLYNVTVVKTFYSKSSRLAKDMHRGLVDVHANIAAAQPSGVKEFFSPAVITYYHESFYVKRQGPVMLRFHDLMNESKFALALVAAALVLSLMLLVLEHARRLKRCSPNEVAKLFMFLLAIFYSTSYPLPQVGRWSRPGGFVCVLRLIGMLPFSNYFRSELTSRVTLPAFPEQMDTLAKLERALDQNKIAPCVVKDTFPHEQLSKFSNSSSINRKLSLALETHKEKDELIKLSYADCLKCAVRDYRICYIVSLPCWFNNPYKRWLVESEEHLRPIFLTLTVSRSYPHKFGFRDVIRKVIEAGLVRPPESRRKSGYLRNYKEPPSVELRPLRFEEIISFLFLFMALLAGTAVVFVLEITIWSYSSGSEKSP